MKGIFMKFFSVGLFVLTTSLLSALEPMYYWNFDRINPKTGFPLSNNGIQYYNAQVIERGGINNTNGICISSALQIIDFSYI